MLWVEESSPEIPRIKAASTSPTARGNRLRMLHGAEKGIIICSAETVTTASGSSSFSSSSSAAAAAVGAAAAMTAAAGTAAADPRRGASSEAPLSLFYRKAEDLMLREQKSYRKVIPLPGDLVQKEAVPAKPNRYSRMFTEIPIIIAPSLSQPVP